MAHHGEWAVDSPPTRGSFPEHQIMGGFLQMLGVFFGITVSNTAALSDSWEHSVSLGAGRWWKHQTYFFAAVLLALRLL
jgi:hypothetical protein